MENNKNIQSKVLEPLDFEKAELDLLRDALKRTPQQRFEMMTTLMKMNIMFKKAKITHKPFTSAN